jgi:hypothetical protein
MDDVFIDSLLRLRDRFPNGWESLGWPADGLSSSDVSDIEIESASIGGWPTSCGKCFPRVAPPTMALIAAEKAYKRGLERAESFKAALDESGAMDEPAAMALAQGYCGLAVFDEFAKELGLQVFRDFAIRMTQNISGLPQEVARFLWRHGVADSVKISRGLRGPGRAKRSVEPEKRSVLDKSQLRLRVNGCLAAEYLARLESSG